MSDREKDISIGNTDVTKIETDMFEKAVMGQFNEWEVDGERFSSRDEAISRALEIEDEKKN
jgi:hypothetical protein